MAKTLPCTLALVCVLTATSVSAAPFGGTDDRVFATRLWSAMVAAKLVGPSSIMSTPYKGTAPHGAVLDTIQSKVTVIGKSGVAIVKRNYGGEGVSDQNVANDPSKYLKAVTVMYKRKGYDADNQDWFWAKYNPDGSLQANPGGVKLAGRIAKGMAKGCIACHSAAPGGDYIFTRN